MVRTNHLRDLGLRARERFDTPVHKCHQIASAFVDLCDRTDISAELLERTIGETHTTHFVAIVPASEISDIEASTGPVYIDPTVDQFSLSNFHDGVTDVGLGRASDLPEVGIFPPDCEERAAWYHRK